MPPRSTTSPRSLWWYGRSGRPVSVAMTLSATCLPCRRACCAVGGHTAPSTPLAWSGTAAASPRANTPSAPGRHMSAVTASRPRTVSAPSVAISGLATTPAVQMRVRVGTTRPSVKVTSVGPAFAMETPSEISIPRRVRISCALRPSFSPSSGMSFGAMSIRCHLIRPGSSRG
ncbi:hypothetical protein SHIRM173S_01326 [Streptomyces hirsutus]